jgi:hypothetical protein
MSPNDRFRMGRIKKVSTVLKTFFLISAAIFGVIGTFTFADMSMSEHSGLSFSVGVAGVGHAVECWFAYRLFSCYADGGLFSAKGIQWMRLIGFASLLMGAWNICHTLSLRLHDGYFGHVRAMPLMTGVILCFDLILFELVFNLAFGFVIILIAWIMDEGRKIQEEQELTV